MAIVSNTSFYQPQLQSTEFLKNPKTPLKDPVDIGLEFCVKKPYTLFKAMYVFPELGKHLGYVPRDNEVLNKACTAAKIAKLSRSPFDFVRNLANSFDMAANYSEGKEIRTRRKQTRVATVADVVREANGVIAPTWEMWDFFIKNAYLPSTPLFQTFGGLSAASLILGMGWNSFDHLSDLHDSKLAELKGAARSAEQYKVAGYMIKLAKDVSYLALGIIGVLSTFFGFVFAPLTICAFSTSSVVFTILGYYHSNLRTEKTFN